MSAEPLFRAIIASIRAVQTALAVLSIGIIVISTVADVVLRYGFGHPIHGAYDIVECLLVVFVFNGMSLVFLDRGHIVIDLVDHLVGWKARRGLLAFGDLASIAALLLMLWAMFDPASQAFDYGDRKLELGVKVWVVWAFAIGGTVGSVICAIAVAWIGQRRVREA
jgi:TRAP-type C4-dicarboxylate transport system permease small subunit